MKSYTPHERNMIKIYGCEKKIKWANQRFEDKLCLMDVLHLLQRFNFKCVYCASPLPAKTWQLDHFYAKAVGGKNKIDNIAPACKWCNQMKHALDGYAFIDRCKNIANNNLIHPIFGDPYKEQRGGGYDL